MVQMCSYHKTDMRMLLRHPRLIAIQSQHCHSLREIKSNLWTIGNEKYFSIWLLCSDNHLPKDQKQEILGLTICSCRKRSKDWDSLCKLPHMVAMWGTYRQLSCSCVQPYPSIFDLSFLARAFGLMSFTPLPVRKDVEWRNQGLVSEQIATSWLGHPPSLFIIFRSLKREQEDQDDCDWCSCLTHTEQKALS